MTIISKNFKNDYYFPKILKWLLFPKFFKMTIISKKNYYYFQKFLNDYYFQKI